MGIIFHIGYVARISHLCRREKFITDAVLWWLQSYVFAIVISAKSWKRLVRGNQQIIFNSLLATVSNTHGSPLFHEQRKLSWRLVYVHSVANELGNRVDAARFAGYAVRLAGNEGKHRRSCRLAYTRVPALPVLRVMCSTILSSLTCRAVEQMCM